MVADARCEPAECAFNVPDVLIKLLSNPSPQKTNRAMQAMLSMKKIDTAALQAYDLE